MTMPDACEARRLHKNGITVAKLAEKYSTTEEQITAIVQGPPPSVFGDVGRWHRSKFSKNTRHKRTGGHR